MAVRALRGPKLLLVEGANDLRFFGALVNHMRLEGLQVRDVDARDDFERVIWALQRIPDVLGRMLPFAEGPAKSLDRLRALESACGEALRELGLPPVQLMDYQGKDNLRRCLMALPSLSGFRSLESIGIVRDADQDARRAFQSVRDALRDAGLPVPRPADEQSEGHPRVSVFILPDNQSPGMLETVCMKSVSDDPAMPCVEAFMACLDRDVPSPPRNRYKAVAQAFLASRQSPGLLVGEAADKGYWCWDSEALEPIKTFLAAL